MALVAISIAPIVSAIGIPDSSEFATYNQARLDSFRASSGQLRVVMLGNSKLKYALHDDDELTLRAHAATGSEMQFLRITNNRAAFSDFSPLLDDILAAKPDVLILQSPLMFAAKEKELDYRLLQAYLRWKLSGGDTEWNPYNIDQVALQFDKPCKKDFTTAALERRVSRIPDTSPRIAKNATDFVRSAMDQGIVVRLLRLPNSPQLDREVSRIEADALLKIIESETTAELWSFSGDVLDESQFCDFVHLDDNGRQLVSTWLIQELQVL